MSAIKTVVYTCYGGAHSSPVAAAIHVGLLPRKARPPLRQLLSLLSFDAATTADRGRLVYVGDDGRGCGVYFVGRGKEPVHAVQNAVESGRQLAGGKDVGVVLFVDTLPYVNGFMRLGGYVSRRLGLVDPGRAVVARATLHVYPRLVHLVRKTEAYVRHATDLHAVGARHDPKRTEFFR